MNIYEKINGFNNGDFVTCRDCGYRFDINDDDYNDEINGIICPNCMADIEEQWRECLDNEEK